MHYPNCHWDAQSILMTLACKPMVRISCWLLVLYCPRIELWLIVSAKKNAEHFSIWTVLIWKFMYRISAYESKCFIIYVNTYCLEIWYGGFLSASTDWPGQLLLFQWWRVVLHVSLSQSLRVKLRRILVAETKKSLSLIWVKTALPNVRYNCRICTVLEGWKPYGNIT